MKLVKQALDVGMFTDRPAEQRQFWGEQLGLPTEGLLRLGGGVHQHRFLVGASVIKVNHSRAPLPVGGTGLRAVSLIRPDIAQSAQAIDPDGNLILLESQRRASEPNLIVHLTVSDLEVHHRFWSETIQLDCEGLGQYRCGSSRVALVSGEASPRRNSWRVMGWSYLTLQVHDCALEHRQAMLRGAVELQPPMRLGNSAIISFISDPDGNAIEISQKASLAGPLD